ncbi:MAG: peptide deformylase [Proteobacteria bacterium]|nr:peptide deformylase [Pseudomonadota bacterium]
MYLAPEKYPFVTDLATLRIPSEEVDPCDPATLELATEMFVTMGQLGVGLAAIQLGVPKRVVVIHPCKIYTPTPVENETFFMANPELLEVSKETSVAVESCLSILALPQDTDTLAPPLLKVEVERPVWAVVRFFDLRAQEVRTLKREGFDARVLQHEIDHIIKPPKLIIDYLPGRKLAAAG